MSYEPRVIISYEDLQKNADAIRDIVFGCKTTNDAWIYLEKMLKGDPIRLRGIDFVICQPELT